MTSYVSYHKPIAKTGLAQPQPVKCGHSTNGSKKNQVDDWSKQGLSS